MNESGRLYAPVRALTDYPKVRQLVGLPPEAGGELIDLRDRLPWPRVVLVEPGSEAGVMLVRFAQDGAFAGDTWHRNVGEAKEQAEYEFGDSLGSWQEIPIGTSDPRQYALKKASQTEDDPE